MSEQNLNKLAEDLTSAELRGDVAFLERTLADDFIGIGPRGFMLTKEEWMARHRSGDLKYESLKLEEQKIRLYGDTAAVLTGREITKGKYQGRDTQGEFRKTEVFVKQNGRWLLASLQLSPITPAP